MGRVDERHRAVLWLDQQAEFRAAKDHGLRAAIGQVPDRSPKLVPGLREKHVLDQFLIQCVMDVVKMRAVREQHIQAVALLQAARKKVLDDYRPLLEEKGFRVEIRPTDETVFADRRGLCFLLGQVVSNSVKYTLEKPVLTFSLESNDTATVLSIRDNGPGVRACDLPYVFEKGFTGDSGHEKNKATGMGLYLAREVAKDLGLTLTAASGWGAGFEIRVTFPVVEK